MSNHGWRNTADSLPDWFRRAIDTPRSSQLVTVADCDVAWQHWPAPADAPPLLLVHGWRAHSHWWDFIAPQLVPGHRVAALDLTGMGDSDWRHSYAANTWSDELVAVADAAGFGSNCQLVAHSFGARIALEAVHRHPDRFAGLVLLDSAPRDPDGPAPDLPPPGGDSDPVYPDRSTAIQRFRLQPPQPCANGFVLEYIARTSLMAADGGGWGWKFDGDLAGVLDSISFDPALYRDAPVPLALLHGAQSALCTPDRVAYLQRLAGPMPVTVLADAHHHLFLDQPQAFVPALEDLLRRISPA